MPSSPLAKSRANMIDPISTGFMVESSLLPFSTQLYGSDGIFAGTPHLASLNNSTLSNGLADSGRRRFSVNFVGWPGATSTSR